MSMDRKKIIIGALFGVFLFAATLLAAKTTVWKWTDDKGSVHFSQYYDQIPDKYKGKAVKVEVEEQTSSESSQSGSGQPSQKKDEDSEKPDQKKADFKNKARGAVANVAAIEAKIPPKSSECDVLQLKAVNMPTIANRQAAEKCRQELEKINADLDAAIQYLDEGLYEEGSAAGLSYPEMDQILEEVKAEQEKK